MNNYINKLSCLYIEQRNYLSGPLVYDHTIISNHISLSKHGRPWSGSSYKSCLIWVCSVCKSVKRRLCELKGFKMILRVFVVITSLDWGAHSYNWRPTGWDIILNLQTKPKILLSFIKSWLLWDHKTLFYHQTQKVSLKIQNWANYNI